MPHKINLLVDTNSLSHLSMIEFNQKRLFKLVVDCFNVYTCQTVFGEFGKGIHRGNPENRNTYRILQKRKNKIVLESKNIDKIENKLFCLKYISSRSQKDKGERHLVSLALEQVYVNKFSQCIVLADDQNAVDGFLSHINHDFQLGKIWTVFDLIAYLYFKIKITYEEAQSAVRDLGVQASISVKKYRNFNGRRYDERGARQILLKMNLDRLNKVKQMIDILPRR